MIPHRTPFFLPLIYPSLTWRMPEHEKTLYLTFDDGPVPGPTEFVLDQLARISVHATFFCIGDNIRKHPAVFAALLANGHTVGNHTVNHLSGWATPARTYMENVSAFDAIAAEAGLDQPTRLFRPPYGRVSKNQIRMLNAYRIVMWDVLSRDYDPSLSEEKCLLGTIAACRNGSIVVFHDSFKAWRNLEYALPRFIDHFGAMGYRFAPLVSP